MSPGLILTQRALPVVALRGNSLFFESPLDKNCN
jgi:hypothetical protein